jgi:hypothetical protein
MRRYVFTQITALRHDIHREMIIKCLHDYQEMITLNPFVINYQPCEPLRAAPADEYYCAWFQITDQIKYLPGLSKNVSYKACFHALPTGLQTHVYAPMNLDIKDKWLVEGNMPNEPTQTIELGLPNAPRQGLYLREDIDIGCKRFLTSFVEEKLKTAHKALVDRLVMRADMMGRLSKIGKMPISQGYSSVGSLRDTECKSNTHNTRTVGFPLPCRVKYHPIPELP